jgi:N-methylhydantoinase B/oxoprolinase/acetone carboxylase alpha subunit
MADLKMDDGTRIQLEVRIDREEGTAEFDWTGTGHQTLGNVSVLPRPLADSPDEFANISLIRRYHLHPSFDD